MPVRRLKPISWRHQGVGGGATAALGHPALLLGWGRYVCAYGAPPWDPGLSIKGLMEA